MLIMMYRDLLTQNLKNSKIAMSNQTHLTTRQKVTIELEIRRRKKLALTEEANHRYKNSLSKFIADAWHVLEPAVEFKGGWAIDAMCEHLMAITNGEFNRFLCNVPPGMMKSLTFNVWWPAWEWGPKKMPHLKSLGASFSLPNEIRDNLKLRNLVESEWFQERWGGHVAFAKSQTLKTNFWLTGGGGRAVTPIGSLTGNRSDRLTIDDPHSVDSAESETVREHILQTFDRSATSRLVLPTHSVISVIMQRLHVMDLSGHVLKKVKNSVGEMVDRGYVHLMLPMEFEPKRKCTTIIGFEDPRTEAGELLHPERFPRWVVERDKAAMGEYAHAGQNQQNPAPAGGGLFKDEYWKYYDPDNMPEFKYRFIVADTAMKIGKDNDYSVFQLHGVAGDGADEKCYLIDQRRAKFTAPDLNVAMEEFYRENYDHDLLPPMIEDKASGTGLIQYLQEVGIAAEAIKPEWTRLSKEARALARISLISQGKLMLPADAHWLEEFKQEHSVFPRGVHDDQVDATIYAMYIFKDRQSIYGGDWLA